MQIQETVPTVGANQFETESHVLERVKEAARFRLTRLASIEESRVAQCYLFVAGRLCGMRFVAGEFQACWNTAGPFIEIKRGQQTIEQLPLAQPKRQKAA